MKNKKKIISALAIVLIIVLIVTATYAYFQAQTGEGSSTDINITTATVDNLTFETGDAISINATQTNFASGLDSLSDDTYAKATLVANNDTNSASANYYVYLNISTNEFEYTTSDSTAELILSITTDGTEVTSLDGYDYVSVTDGNSNVISGFDITTASGLITIADNYLIESTGIEVDDWEITVTFVNLDSDQSGNAGKSFSASLIIQSDAQPTLSNYIISLLGIDSTLYYHASDLSEDTTGTVYGVCYYDGNEVYNFESWGSDGVTESSCNTVYKITDDDYAGYWDSTIGDNFTSPLSVSWDSNEGVCVIDNLNSGTYYLYTWYYFNTPTEEQCTGYAYSYQCSEYYYLGIEHVGSGEWVDSTYGAQDDSYRYSGASDKVDNYVCFGDNSNDTNNLYRIIGVFQNDSGEYEVKLIKADYANSDLLGTDEDYSSSTYSASDYSNYTGSHDTINRYYWSVENYDTSFAETGYYNDWSYSSLNKVNLNTNYLNNIGTKRSNMISNHAWIVGGNGADATTWPLTAKTIYNYEIVNPSSQVASIYEAKIGLVYVSDYVYASNPDGWGETVTSDYYMTEYYYYIDNIDNINDWMYMGLDELTITRSTYTLGKLTFRIKAAGHVEHQYFNMNSESPSAVRPTFYLNSSVVYIGGSGTIDDPYTIA